MLLCMEILYIMKKQSYVSVQKHVCYLKGNSSQLIGGSGEICCLQRGRGFVAALEDHCWNARFKYVSGSGPEKLSR